MKSKLLTILLISVFILSSCQSGGTSTSATEAVTSDVNPPAETQPPATEPPPPPTATSTPSGPPALAQEPQEITFQASDGQELHGLYYPAAVNPAPLVVLMHWVTGDMSDWYEVAVWLQNRGQVNPFPNPGDMKWWDPTWFPPVPADRSYAVFIFSFRNCKPMNQNGCPTFDEAGWLLDAQAAMSKAVTLEGVDPTRIVSIGSSIGADGAIDGCGWLVEQEPGSCQGALSLSPGNYLTLSYKNMVKILGENQPPLAAWCLADENEIGFCNQAADAGNTKFRAVEIRGGQHGNMLLRPDLDPLPMILILDFLVETVGP